MSKDKKLEPVAPHAALKALDKFYVEARELLAQNPENFNFMAYACSSGEEYDKVIAARWADPNAMHAIMVSIADDPHTLEILALALSTVVSKGYEIGERRNS